MGFWGSSWGDRGETRVGGQLRCTLAVRPGQSLRVLACRGADTASSETHWEGGMSAKALGTVSGEKRGLPALSPGHSLTALVTPMYRRGHAGSVGKSGLCSFHHPVLSGLAGGSGTTALGVGRALYLLSPLQPPSLPWESWAPGGEGLGHLPACFPSRFELAGARSGSLLLRNR